MDTNDWTTLVLAVQAAVKWVLILYATWGTWRLRKRAKRRDNAIALNDALYEGSVGNVGRVRRCIQ